MQLEPWGIDSARWRWLEGTIHSSSLLVERSALQARQQYRRTSTHVCTALLGALSGYAHASAQGLDPFLRNCPGKIQLNQLATIVIKVTVKGIRILWAVTMQKCCKLIYRLEAELACKLRVCGILSYCDMAMCTTYACSTCASKNAPTWCITTDRCTLMLQLRKECQTLYAPMSHILSSSDLINMLAYLFLKLCHLTRIWGLPMSLSSSLLIIAN